MAVDEETPQFQPVLQIINCWIFIETRLDVCKSNHRNTCDASAALWSRSASAIPRTYLLANWTDQRICVWSSLVLGMVYDKKDGSFGHGSKHAILYMIYYYIPYLVEYGINIHVPAAWMSPGVPGSWRRAVWSWCKFQPWPPGKNPLSTHPFVDGYPHSSPLPAYCNILILYMACKWHRFSYFPVASHDSHVTLLFFFTFAKPRHVLPRPSASRKTGRTNLGLPPWSAPWPLGDLGSDGLGLGICPRAEDRFLSSPVDERMWNAQTDSRPWWDEIRKGLGKKRLWNLKVVPNHQNYRRKSVSPTWWNILCIIYIYR